MKQTIKKLITSPTAGRLGGATRAAMTLALMLLTAMTAWAQSITYTSYTATAGTAGANSNEGYASLVDNNTGTKWCVTSLGNPTYIEFQSAATIIPVGYTMTTGNDTGSQTGRNPLKWTVKAKVNTTDAEWTVIDSRDASANTDDAMPAANTTAKTYTLSNTTAYQYFRLEITAIASGSTFQLSEFQFQTFADNSNLGTGSISGLNDTYDYNGGAAIPISYTVKDYNGTTLVPGTDYDAVITNSSNESVTTVTEKGTYTLIVTGKGDYTGSLSKTFRVVLSGSGTSESPYIISNSDDWDIFAEMIASSTNSSAYYKLSNTFDNSANPVTATVGTSDHPFSGHFDGNGRTLTLNISGEVEGIALFHTLDNADIHDLTLAGNITVNGGGKRGASLAVFSSGTTTVTRCASAVTITDTYDGGSKDNAHHAGFISENSGTLSFDHCVFRGKMLGSKAKHNGGFVRWNENSLTFTDCIFAPAELTMPSYYSGTFSWSDRCTFVRSYYTQTFGDAQGEQAYTTAEAAEAVNGTGSISVTVCGTTVYVPKAITLSDFTLISSSTYAISNGDDLRNLASYVKAGNNCKDLTFRMTADIDYSGRNDYIPIGYNDTKYFSGTFDGQGHTISGVNAAGSNFNGLFGYLGTSGTVSNLILTNSSISGGIFVGGIVSRNQGMIENCHVLADVTVSANNNNADIGGIVGNNNGTVDGCTSAATISSYANYMGGIVGYNSSTLRNCLAVGATMTGGTYSGAVAGISNNYGTLSSNYYSRCTSSGSTSGIGCNGADVNDAMPLSDHIVTVSGHVTADAASKVYGISPYYQYAAGATVTLGYSGDVPAGYRPVYTVTNDGSSETVAVSEAGTFTMPANNVTVSATLTPIFYAITYDLDGGTVATENPTNYTIESADITLNAPTRTGYEFAGWTGTDLSEATETVTIAQGSTGDREYTATWTASIVNTGSAPTIALTQDQNGTTATLDGASEGSVTIAADVAVDDVKLNRTFNSGQKTCICWPFDVTTEKAAALGKFYAFTGVTAEGQIQMTEVTEGLTANTPYILEPNSDITEAIDFGAKTLKAGGPASAGSGFTFKGIYSRVKWTTNTEDPLYDAGLANELGHAYGFALEAKKDLNGTKTYTPGQFVKLGEGAHSRAFRAYMLYDGAWDGNEPSTAARRTTRGTSLPDVIDIVWLSAGGQTTGISTATVSSATDEWYTLDGRRLSGKPAKKGLYIKNGSKIVIK